MRSASLLALIVLWSGAAFAQSPAPPGDAPAASLPAAAASGISRDDYIAKARDNAAKRAATRFDAMDANHDGVVTRDEAAAYRAAHARKKPAEPQ